MIKSPILNKTILGIFILIVLFVMFLPIHHLVTMSIKFEVDTFAIPPKWLFTPTFNNYRNLFRTVPYASQLFNSLYIGLLSVAVSLVVGLPGAFSLSQYNFKGKDSILMFILSSKLVPPMCVLIPFFMFYSRLRLIDTRLGLIIIYLTFHLPLVIWLMKTFYDDIPRDIFNSAKIDGASVWQIFLQIATPLVTPGIVAAGILSFNASWIEFLYALVLTRRHARTAVVGLTAFMRFEDTQWGSIAAGAMLVSIPMILFAVTLRKFLISGLTQGAIKE